MQPIIKVNLTERRSWESEIPVDWARAYLGGASLAARYLYEDLRKDIDAFDERSPLLFLNGPLSGTGGPAVGRFVICARSPATGLWGESNIGGFWGPELRKAGYYGLWITGRSDEPVWLQIQDGRVDFHEAADIWGMETYAAQQAIQRKIGTEKHRIAVIGPAGELGIPFSLILTDHGRVAGRTGMGAVMGSKNLKGIAIRGTGTVPVANDRFSKLRSDINRELRIDNLSRASRELGTAGGADYFDYLGEMPKKYFQSGVFDGAYKVSGSTMAETILTNVSACHACVIACGRVVNLGKTEDQKGPEYETIVGFGPNLLIDNLSFITRTGDLCDRYGMDSISLSNTIGLAFKLFEDGFVTEADTGGLRLEWGSQNAVEDLVHQTVRKEGLGYWIAQGSRQFAKQFASGEEAIQVNGLEVAYHDPRAASGMALAYATSPRGACHNQSDYFMVDVLGHAESELGIEKFNRHAGVEKVESFIRHQNWRSLCNSLVLCYFANVPPTDLLDLLNLGSEFDYSLDDLMVSGERGWNLKRIINGNFGLRAERDVLPPPLLKAYTDGGAEGYLLPFEEMLKEYYNLRGWDANTGLPDSQTKARLDLTWTDKVVAD